MVNFWRLLEYFAFILNSFAVISFLSINSAGWLIYSNLLFSVVFGAFIWSKHVNVH